MIVIVFVAEVRINGCSSFRPLLLSFGYRPQVPEVQFLTGEFVELKKRAACYGSCPGMLIKCRTS